MRHHHRVIGKHGNRARMCQQNRPPTKNSRQSKIRRRFLAIAHHVISKIIAVIRPAATEKVRSQRKLQMLSHWAVVQANNKLNRFFKDSRASGSSFFINVSFPHATRQDCFQHLSICHISIHQNYWTLTMKWNKNYFQAIWRAHTASIYNTQQSIRIYNTDIICIQIWQIEWNLDWVGLKSNCSRFSPFSQKMLYIPEWCFCTFYITARVIKLFWQRKQRKTSSRGGRTLFYIYITLCIRRKKNRISPTLFFYVCIMLSLSFLFALETNKYKQKIDPFFSSLFRLFYFLFY